MIEHSKFILILIVLVACISCNQTGEKNKTVNSSAPIKVILLGGQSNMVGQGNKKQIIVDSDHPNIVYHDYGYKFDLKPSTTTFGPEVGIIEQLENHFSNEKFIIIKYAIGGSSMTDWNPEYSAEKAATSGNLRFGNMYKRLQMIIDDVTSGQEVQFAAMAWMQGERDAKNPEAGQAYQDNLSRLINSIRKDLNAPELPFIIGKVNPPQDRYPALMEVRQAQINISNEMPSTYLIDIDDIEKWEDDLHYSTNGSLELGKRFGRKIVELLKK